MAYMTKEISEERIYVNQHQMAAGINLDLHAVLGIVLNLIPVPL